MLLVAARPLQRALEHAVALRIQRLEAEVFQLELDAVEAEALGDRRVDLQRLARDGAAPRAAASRRCVRMLCVRSASLTRMTRRSRTIASSILRKLSACASSRLLNLIWSSLVTPSTSSATSAPKRSASSSFGVGVSSMTSCRMAATMVSASRCRSARMCGGGDADGRCRARRDRRFWPSWAEAPNSAASRMRSTCSGGR